MQMDKSLPKSIAYLLVKFKLKLTRSLILDCILPKRSIVLLRIVHVNALL